LVHVPEIGRTKSLDELGRARLKELQEEETLGSRYVEELQLKSLLQRSQRQGIAVGQLDDKGQKRGIGRRSENQDLSGRGERARPGKTE